MTCEGDVVYTEAVDEDAAFKRLCEVFGDMPREIVIVEQVDEMPDVADRI